MEVFESLPSLSPMQFFGVVVNCLYVENTVTSAKKWLLPSMADLLDEEELADVYMGWNEKGVSFFMKIHAPFEDGAKDCVDLFLDTRDLKHKGVVSRFCHHFRFSPEGGREMTRFRGEDVHPLAHPAALKCDGEVGKKKYALSIAIPAECLHGYDPANFSRLGFTYRINRKEGAPAHFLVSSLEYVIEQHPATWGSIQLVR